MKDKRFNSTLDGGLADGISALMVSRQALETVGYMDEQFYLYMSDVDWPRHFGREWISGGIFH